MAQFEQTMKTIRVTCGGKFKLSDELIDGMPICLRLSYMSLALFIEKTLFCRFEEGKIHRDQQRPKILRVLRGADERHFIEEERDKRAKDVRPNRQPGPSRVETALA